MDSGGESLAQQRYLRCNASGYGDRVAVRLARNVQQHRRLPVGLHHGVQGHHRRSNCGDVRDVDWCARWSGLHHQMPKLLRTVRLRTH